MSDDPLKHGTPPGSLRHFAVTAGDAVGVAGEEERQVSHVEDAAQVVGAVLHHSHPAIAQDVPHQVQRELVLARGHGRMRRKDALGAYRLLVLVRRFRRLVAGDDA